LQTTVAGDSDNGLLAVDALIPAPLVPTALYQLMQSKGIELLEAPVDEFLASSGMRGANLYR
jgi:hypothetical protein